jgi:hypothetical protein
MTPVPVGTESWHWKRSKEEDEEGWVDSIQMMMMMMMMMIGNERRGNMDAMPTIEPNPEG